MRMAKTSVVADFTRQMSHNVRKHQNVGGDVAQVIEIEDDSSDFVKAPSTRWVKEQNTALWAASARSMAVNTLFVVCGITTGVALYLGVRYKPVILIAVPFSLAGTIQAWGLLEISWETERLTRQAAHVRNRRLANPLHSIPVKPNRLVEDDSLMS